MMFDTFSNSGSKSGSKSSSGSKSRSETLQNNSSHNSHLPSNIQLVITRKRVKNINFRVKIGQVNISAPWYASDKDVQHAIEKRLSWIMHSHQQLLDKQAYRNAMSHDAEDNQTWRLWGQEQTTNTESNSATAGTIPSETEKLQLYRAELAGVMPALFDKWQPIVGATANEQRIKKMKTRWGSCNVKAKRVWLSVYLPEYPLECTEYVIVHELCHLHHANHSRQFWQCVADAMPDYQHWHGILAGKTGHLD